MNAAARLIQFAVKTARAKQDVLMALAIKAGAVLAGFVVTFLLGSRLGAAGTGQYALITQTAAFFGVVGLLGLDVSVVRHFAKTLAAGAPLAVTSFGKVVAIALGLMLMLSLVLWLGGELIWQRLFGDAVPRTMLLVLCILLVTRGGTTLFSGLLRSQHRFVLGQMIGALNIPLVTALALASGWAQSVTEALWAAALGGAGSILIGAAAMRRHIATGKDAVHIPLRPILASSLPLWGVGIALNIGDWYGLAVAAQMLGAADAGIYRVAVQIAASLQIVTMTVFSIYTAKISTAFHAKDLPMVAVQARSALRVGITFAAPLAVVLILCSKLILGLIGPEFESGSNILIILIIGQLSYVIIGPSGLILAMSGNEKINLAITLIGTTTLLVLVPISVKFWGLPGIAVSIVGVASFRQMLAYFAVRSRLRLRIWSGTVAPDKSPSP
jgi:O-antigen/teichoic acid export membrane protein